MIRNIISTLTKSQSNFFVSWEFCVISGVSPFGVSSITFIATADSGTVSFSDVSSDVLPAYGPYLDNVSMTAQYLFVDIDVDSNNDGVINAFDDPVEMAPNGGKILAVGYGQCQPIQLLVHTNQTNVNSNNIVYQLEYDNSKILLYTANRSSGLPQAVYGTDIDISQYYIAPNTDLSSGFLTADGSINTIYVDGFALGETAVTLKAYSVYQDSVGNTVRELISSDEIKLNVGFDLDTDSNENGTIDSTANFTLSDGKLSVRPNVEDMIEDLIGHGKTLSVGTKARVKISKSAFNIPADCQLQLIVSPGLTAYANWENESLPELVNPSSLLDDTLGEVYIVSSDFPQEFYIECSDVNSADSIERSIHLRLVREDETSSEIILARDTVRFNCVPYGIDLRVDSNNDGSTTTDDNQYEDDNTYAGYIIPYGSNYNDNLSSEQVHNVDKARVYISLPQGSNKTDWDSKYVRLCQVDSNLEILQVLNVYQLGNEDVFFWNANSGGYQFTDLEFIAEESSKNFYEAWIRVECTIRFPLIIQFNRQAIKN